MHIQVDESWIRTKKIQVALTSMGVLSLAMYAALYDFESSALVKLIVIAGGIVLFVSVLARQTKKMDSWCVIKNQDKTITLNVGARTRTLGPFSSACVEERGKFWQFVDTKYKVHKKAFPKLNELNGS